MKIKVKLSRLNKMLLTVNGVKKNFSEVIGVTLKKHEKIYIENEYNEQFQYVCAMKESNSEYAHIFMNVKNDTMFKIKTDSHIIQDYIIAQAVIRIAHRWFFFEECDDL